MVIEDCYQEHEVPQQRQESHQTEEQPHHGGLLGVLRPEGEELLISQFRERSIGSAGVVRDSLVFLSPDVVLDPLPAEVGLALLVHHQVAEDEKEAVAGEVEASPEMAVRHAGLLPVVSRDLAHAGLGLHQVEEGGDGVPDWGGDGEPGQVVLDDADPATAVGVAGDVDEAGQEEAGPEPGALGEPQVEEVVWLSEVTPDNDNYIYNDFPYNVMYLLQ